MSFIHISDVLKGENNALRGPFSDLLLSCIPKAALLKLPVKLFFWVYFQESFHSPPYMSIGILPEGQKFLEYLLEIRVKILYKPHIRFFRVDTKYKMLTVRSNTHTFAVGKSLILSDGQKFGTTLPIEFYGIRIINIAFRTF